MRPMRDVVGTDTFNSAVAVSIRVKPSTTAEAVIVSVDEAGD
jgi:hypothetical protein